MSSHQTALNKLIEGGIDPSFAQQILSLATKYNDVHFPNLGPGPDSWGSTMELTVQCRAGYVPAQYSVKFYENKHY